MPPQRLKQSESCRQSFNLKRARSPWGVRGAGRIKKFNNSMFYGPRKWDLSTGSGWGCSELTVWSVHRHKKTPDTKKAVSRSVLSWAHDLFLRTKVQSELAAEEGEETTNQVSRCCRLSLFTPTVSFSHMLVLGIFQDFLRYFPLCPTKFHSNISLKYKLFWYFRNETLT